MSQSTKRPGGALLWIVIAMSVVAIGVIAVVVWLLNSAADRSPLLQSLYSAMERGKPPVTQISELQAPDGWNYKFGYARPGSDLFLLAINDERDILATQYEYWDYTTAAKSRDFERSVPFWPVQFSPDGTWLSSDALGMAAHVLSAETGDANVLFSNWLDNEAELNDENSIMTFSGDSQRVILFKDDKLAIYESSTAKEIATHDVPGDREIMALVGVAGGTLVACLSTDGQLLIINYETGELANQIPWVTAGEHYSFLTTFDPDVLIIDGSRSGSGALNWRTGERLWTLDPEQYPLSVLPGGDVLVAADYDGNIHLWDLHTYEHVFVFPAHGRQMGSGVSAGIVFAAASADGSVLVTLRGDEKLKFWRISE